MAKTMLAISLLVGAGACSGAPTAVRSTPTTGAAPTTEPTTTEVPTTTAPEPTTTTSTAPVPVEEAPVTVPTTRARSAPTTTAYVAPAPVASGGDGPWSIPTAVVMCESKGNWNAENASGAAGPYQLMPEHFGGESALNQSRQAQHDMAAYLWNSGVNTKSGLGPQNWEDCL